MICEMCGAEVTKLKKITIEGSNLSVCPKCAKFGQDHTVKKGIKESTSPSTITERLQRREKRLKTKDVFEQSIDELAFDYPKRVRKARTSMDLSQDDLAKKINEKKSVVAKLENGDMVPEEKLVKKLENALGISLKEKIIAIEAPKRGSSGRGLTLGDFLRVEEE